MTALYLTWKTARAGFGHGLPRFLAFEAILGLVALNLRYWTDDPFSVRQLISWALLMLSGLLAIHAFWLLGRSGKSEGEFERTTILVTGGAYRLIRHPLYASLLYLSIGALLKNTSLLAGGLALVAFGCLYLTARFEERENAQRFGDPYRRYMQSTKMFVPFIF